MQHPNDDGVRRLWCAVIIRAIADVDDWLYGDGASNFLFSGERRQMGFIWICEELGIDANRLRQQCMTRTGRLQILRHRQGSLGRMKRAA